jgi:hypothetical protein
VTIQVFDARKYVVGAWDGFLGMATFPLAAFLDASPSSATSGPVVAAVFKRLTHTTCKASHSSQLTVRLRKHAAGDLVTGTLRVAACLSSTAGDLSQRSPPCTSPPMHTASPSPLTRRSSPIGVPTGVSGRRSHEMEAALALSPGSPPPLRTSAALARVASVALPGAGSIPPARLSSPLLLRSRSFAMMSVTPHLQTLVVRCFLGLRNPIFHTCSNRARPGSVSPIHPATGSLPSPVDDQTRPTSHQLVPTAV